ncbi:hypothetical protein BDZ91DRAFT_717626 [Kalaharituber pfeilii]|nr:hypothetical protein BDZ91DRAFT_717626 [Kalaharituber pfeilii]
MGSITGIRWLRKKTILLEEGKKTSSVVVYLETPTETGKVRLGGRWLNTSPIGRHASNEINKKKKKKKSGRTIVVHGIAVTKKLGKVRDWIETANPWMGKIVVARWLVTKERREGKKVSSIVIYLEGEVESDSQTPAKVRLSGKWYDSCLYDWDRNSKGDRKGKRRDVEEMDLTT